MLYIRLFHGRIDPTQDMDNWGSDGPVFGPYEFVHTTYSWHVILGNQDKNCDELNTFEDMLFYDGMYYGDWSVMSEEVFEIAERYDDQRFFDLVRRTCLG